MILFQNEIEERLNYLLDTVNASEPIRIHGRIIEVIGLMIVSNGPAASIGEICNIERNGIRVGQAEVVGFRKKNTLLMPLGTIEGIHPGLTVSATRHPLMVSTGENLLGRVLNGLGVPIDNKGPLNTIDKRSVFSAVPNPLSRNRITEPFHTGIKAIDSLITIGKGQRMGIFAGSGVGKSVLMGMMAKNCKSDINVIALIGERGREVREFIERDLGPEGMARSVLVVATSDQPALIRIKGALIAASIAEYFRDQGKNVLFLADSITRLAMAQREIGLAVGEPPATKGYTPSVFSLLPQFLERAGNSDKGTITGLFTVLVEGDDMDEPIADTARSILDGHIVLSRKLAHQNHFPAIDVLESISRCMNDIAKKEHVSISSRIKDLMAAYRENEDLIQIGAYVAGTNERVDRAIKIQQHIKTFLRQSTDTSSDFDGNIKKLRELLAAAG
ncbi:flagellar protein export ATPase FliI [Chitinispirillales bacterium ANBcel5]|uniref:flagellar protein export ATPase FliI n=1 Tax=Cellulosispirillum alkaliphilum TaxID=3039283 RepID=UPI002A538CA7|nr:flagellar protein export ATPase FliI [Chitinispirillales bacterium ANBcel5]